MSDKVKKISGKKITLIVIASLLAALLLAVGLFFGISSCTSKRNVPANLKEGFTIRKALPEDGSLPTDHSGLDNIGYMATVLDNQPSYHAYANNSTKSTGYEQVTQTWKDYQSAAVNGTGNNVMVCSDLSYSSLVKASTQTCFVGSDSAYMRSGAKPKKASTPEDIEWSTQQPEYYTSDSYLKKYGEFSTEISVYVINEETVESCDDVVDNGDGTYSQKFYLKEDAACWYRNGMKTRGSLKTLPEFEKIEITFTFDGGWQILSSYCEEKAKIAPSALGGVQMGSNSKTTTEFDYSEAGFDSSNFAHFKNYYEKYVGKDLGNGPSDKGDEPALLDVLGGGFSKVVDANGDGQKFGLDINIGGTAYTGKAYAKLSDMGDILGSLEVCLALEKKGSGRQDLFVHFIDGGINAYYGDDFAVVADINKVAEAVKGITEWVNSLKAEQEPLGLVPPDGAEGYAEDESSLDIESLLAALDFSYTDTSARIAIVSDDLLGLGIGIDATLDFIRVKEEDGSTYYFKDLSLNSLTFNDEPIELGLSLVPDDEGEKVSRDEKATPADIADYINGVEGLLNSKTYLVDINLDGSAEMQYVNGLKLSATAQIKQEKGFKEISVNVPLTVEYGNLSIKAEAFYTVNLGDGTYGDVYLFVKEINKKAVNAKVYCDIKDISGAVNKLIDMFDGNGEQGGAQTIAEENLEEKNTVAKVINVVLGLDYSKVITDLKANSEQISVSVDIDELLSAFEVDLGISVGKLALTVNNGEEKVSLGATLSELGLKVKLSGSDKDIPVPETDEYANLTAYVNGVYGLLNSETIIVELKIDGTAELAYINGLEMEAGAQLKLENGFNEISVYLPVRVAYGDLSVEAEAFYTVNLENGGYGEVYLSITAINGKDYALKLYCNVDDTVDAVERLISLIAGGNGNAATLSAEDSEVSAEEANTVAKIINAVINVDYASIIKELSANQTAVTVTVNADEILKALKFGTDISLGELSLKLGLDASGNVTLSGSLENLGITLGVNGSDDKLNVPEKSEYTDVIEFIDLISAATREAQEIMEKQDIEFAIGATLNIDGVTMAVNGLGEVSWNDGKIRVALDLRLTIAENENSETVAVKFVYDETAEDVRAEENGEEQAVKSRPLVRFTVNELGLEIYRSDINGLEELFGSIKNVIAGMISGNGSAATPEDSTNGGADAATEENGVMALSDDESFSQPALDYVKILGVVLDTVSDITVELKNGVSEDANVKDLFISYAEKGSLALGANGGLSLELNTQPLTLNASVKAGEGETIDAVNSVIDSGEYEFYTRETFLKAVYDYVLDLLDNLSVKNLLGSDTYTVEVVFNGSDSGIEELKEINVSANLYYTENEKEGKLSKLAEADLNLDINGTQVTVKAHCTDRSIYVSLENVGGVELKDVAFRADLDNIYEAVETLVDMLQSKALTDILNAISGQLIKTSASADGAEDGATEVVAPETDDKASFALTNLINYILTLDINEVINYEEISVNGKTHKTLTVNPDGILEALGLDLKIGAAYIEVNPENHSVYASVINGEAAWLTLVAEAVKNSDHATFIPSDKYIDINFVSTLLGDLKSTLDGAEKTDGENGTQTLISFAGDITAEVKYSVVSAKITLKDAVLTAGLDKDGDLYLAFTASLDTNTAKIGISINIGETSYITAAGDISVTYSNGLLTFGRNGVYKVMTLEYLLDNALADESPVKWLLGTGDMVWNILKGAIPLDLNSGLTTPQTLTLYELKNSTNSGEFYLASIINSFAYKLGGEPQGYKPSSIAGAADKLGLGDNYYAFDVNLNSLTDGIIPTLYAGILRDDSGIKGIKAYANISGFVDLTLNLDNRSSAHNANFYKEVKNSENIDLDYFKGAAKNETDHTTPVFGCYDMTKSGENRYIASDVLDAVTLTVYNQKGEAKKYELNFGSTVYLTNAFAPEWANDDKTRVYVYNNSSHEEIKVESIVIYEDTFIYKTVSAAAKKEILYHTDISGIDVVSAAFDLNGSTVTLQKYEVDGYTLRGMYSDEERKNEITEEMALSYGGAHVYCVYTKDTVTVNGVKYTFIGQEQAYHVSGFDLATIVPYTESGSYLTLESEIGGYPVTEIEAGALKQSYVKNVIVPESIVKVGAQAFMDNVDMESVTFLAQTVHLGGTKWDGDDRFVFYGCSTKEDENATKLKLYYNTVTSDNNNTDWFGFRRTGTNKYNYNYYFIGNTGHGDSRNGTSSKGFEGDNWAYVNFNVVAVDNLYSVKVNGDTFGFATDGIKTSAFDSRQIIDAVMQTLNGLTSARGYVNAFTVRVSCDYDGVQLNGKMYTVTLTVTEKPESEWWYALTLNGDYEGNETAVTPAGEMQVFNNTYYVRAGSTVELKPASGLAFDGYDCQANLTLQENGSYVFAMPENPFTVNVTYKNLVLEEVTLISYVNSEYGGATLTADGYTLSVASESSTEIAAPYAEGYTFLGWAYDKNNDGLLTFTTNTVTAESAVPVYYAIWAVNHGDVSFTVNDFGTLPVVNDGSVSEGKFYNWYAGNDETFENGAVSAITVTDTVLRARLQYTMTVTVNGSKGKVTLQNSKVETCIGDEREENTKFNGAASTSITREFALLEGENIYLYNIDGNKKDYHIYRDSDGTSVTGQINVKTGNATAGINVTTHAAEINSITYNGNGISVDSATYRYDIEVKQNMTFVFAN